MRKTVLLVSLMCIVPGLFTLLGKGYKSVIFERECQGHIKRAADANTIALATEEMTQVVNYLEAQQLTYGYTSVLYNTPDEDVNFWYKNLKASLEQLQQETSKHPEATPLEQSNLLMKLRQTLLDHGQGGESPTVPAGISVYPKNLSWAICEVTFYPLAVLALIVFCFVLSEPEMFEEK